MIDLSFMEEEENLEDISPEEKKETELAQLADLARYVGSYTWQYKGKDGFHDGIVAQELLNVPGLRDAVKKGPDGSLTVDANFVSLATLGYVAALVRLILDQIPVTSTPEDQEDQEEVKAEKPVEGPAASEVLEDGAE